MEKGIAHLHVHTGYSLLDGTARISELVSEAKKQGAKHLAITDHGNMFGVVQFYKECKSAGINPVIGCELYVAPGSARTKEADEKYYHLIALASNNTGYHNLVKLVSYGYKEGFYYKPRVDVNALKKWHDGIIFLSGCIAGEIPQLILKGELKKAEERTLYYKKIFGEGNFFLEIQNHGLDSETEVLGKLKAISQKTGVPLVATNDVHYVWREDSDAHDTWVALQTGKRKDDPTRLRYASEQYHLRTLDEMLSLFPGNEDAVYRSQEIAERCHVEFDFGTRHIPEFNPPAPYDSKTYLRVLAETGLHERYPDPKGYKERLDYELKVIDEMGFSDYFLIVWDFINYARKNGIPIGPGRGSAAGSIVAYCLRITDVDPIKYNLLFERFLNPERVSMPDIDVDICFERRQEVIDYVVKKYGKNNVCQIITFGTAAAKMIVKDVGRTLGISYALCDKIAKLIPSDTKIVEAVKTVPELQELAKKSEIAELLKTAARLEGLPRHSSIHAAGVVICGQPVDELIPLSVSVDGTIVSQFNMVEVEELGLLKMDFLGLRTLTVLNNVKKHIMEATGKKIDFSQISLNDSEVMDFLSSGDLAGVFQLESKGMEQFIHELKPESFEDVVAGIALYRPGPMDFIPDYLKGKKDRTKVTYLCPQLKPILEPTYGCIVYQEQVMQIVRDLGGYTLGRSDILRRAMSKKKASVMEKERQNFVYGNLQENIIGCVGNGISEQLGNRIYDEMTDFAKYAFNKSHAAAYAVIAVWCAWCKLHYPAYFAAAQITSVSDKRNDLLKYLNAFRKYGINFLLPDINESEERFTASGRDVRYGLSAIKDVGKDSVKKILEERNRGGSYRSLYDFCNRLSAVMTLNEKAMAAFIHSGAFDCFGKTRRALIEGYKNVLSIVNSNQSYNSSIVNILGNTFVDDDDEWGDFDDQTDLSGVEPEVIDLEEYSDSEKLRLEAESVGIYISGHPIDQYNLDTLIGEIADIEPIIQNEVAGVITSVKTVKTKKGDSMAFATIEDKSGELTVVVMPSQYEKHKKLLSCGQAVVVRGKLEEDQLLADLLYDAGGEPSLWISFFNMNVYAKHRENIDKELAEAPGNENVYIWLMQEKMRKKVSNIDIRKVKLYLSQIAADTVIHFM